MKVKNLFALEPEEREGFLASMETLMRVREEWELLASVKPQVEPFFATVAEKIATRLREHPLTTQTADAKDAFTAIAQVYFSTPKLNAEYLERRAEAGRAYLKAGFTMSTLVAGISIWIDEWTHVFRNLFSAEPELLARLNRAFALVSLFNLAIIAQQFTFESETMALEMEERLLAKFLRATGISRELYEQMAKTSEEE